MGHEINYSGKKQLYYGPFEVVIHNTPGDCWVSFLGKVWNITSLILGRLNERCIESLLAFAGKDISDWFDPRTGDIVQHIHPVTGCKVFYLPHGPIPDVEVEVPATRWRPMDHTPWWKDAEKYQVGLLSQRARQIRVINPLFGLEVFLNVCQEDTILRIKERYSIYNSDADIYIWRYMGKELKDELTLEENGVADERDTFASVGLSPTTYIPGIFVYYNDDFHLYELDDSD